MYYYTHDCASHISPSYTFRSLGKRYETSLLELSHNQTIVISSCFFRRFWWYVFAWDMGVERLDPPEIST